jgi:hypothetical protein
VDYGQVGIKRKGEAAYGFARPLVANSAHMTVHFALPLAFDLAGLTCRATLAASVKASFTPRLRMAEHSVFPLVSDDALSNLIDAGIC